MNSYLDKAGLARFWRAIKSYVDAHSGGGVSLSSVYPVGSIYMSVNSTSPATLFGGTWERIRDRFLLAAGSTYAAGGFGGEATHTLTKAEIPPHSHTVAVAYPFTAGANKPFVPYASNTTEYGTGYSGVVKTSGGSGHAHNNMPPYLTVYMWKRTA